MPRIPAVEGIRFVSHQESQGFPIPMDFQPDRRREVTQQGGDRSILNPLEFKSLFGFNQLQHPLVCLSLGVPLQSCRDGISA